MSKSSWLAPVGVVILLWSWCGPLPVAANHSFAAHMTLHVLVVAVAAPLIAIGLAASRIDPVPRCAILFPPVLASLVEMLFVWVWHAPAFHHVARHTTWGFVAEQASFCLSGWWLWQSAFGGSQLSTGTERRSAGVLALLLTSMHMTLLGALIALSPRVLFRHSHGGGEPAAQLADQHLGGAVMLVVGGAAYLLGGLVLVSQIVGHRQWRFLKGDVR